MANDDMKPRQPNGFAWHGLIPVAFVQQNNTFAAACQKKQQVFLPVFLQSG